MNNKSFIRSEIRNHPSHDWPSLSFISKAYYVLRSCFTWLASIAFFFPACSFLVLLGAFIDPRENDRPQRWLFRNILRIAGVDFEARYSPGFDRKRAGFFVCNHIDIWDAFIIYSAIPQFVRGLEHESHFKVPAYGWMMRRFGNVPVPPEGNLAKYKQMMKLTRETLEKGVSLIVFAEGTRTRDGRVESFNPGVFRMAIQFGYPIAPMSIVGAYEFSKKGDWKLFPSKITVYIHDTIETKGLNKNDVEALMNRVHAVVAKPVDEYYGFQSDSEDSSDTIRPSRTQAVI
ncbi:MAG TPA: lysophospholipid acyltransferase family protein [Blastocatellia bacterium]|nr:lysophospholipid acyltransferase family protein [Blastocatellia bacterium]